MSGLGLLATRHSGYTCAALGYQVAKHPDKVFTCVNVLFWFSPAPIKDRACGSDTRGGWSFFIGHHEDERIDSSLGMLAGKFLQRPAIGQGNLGATRRIAALALYERHSRRPQAMLLAMNVAVDFAPIGQAI
jgi:hypothetical protein